MCAHDPAFEDKVALGMESSREYKASPYGETIVRLVSKACADAGRSSFEALVVLSCSVHGVFGDFVQASYRVRASLSSLVSGPVAVVQVHGSATPAQWESAARGAARFTLSHTWEERHFKGRNFRLIWFTSEDLLSAQLLHVPCGREGCTLLSTLGKCCARCRKQQKRATASTASERASTLERCRSEQLEALLKQHGIAVPPLAEAAPAVYEPPPTAMYILPPPDFEIVQEEEEQPSAPAAKRKRTVSHEDMSLFWSTTWPALELQGWSKENGTRSSDRYFFPPGISRGTALAGGRRPRLREDFFDSIGQVLTHLIEEQ